MPKPFADVKPMPKNEDQPAATIGDNSRSMQLHEMAKGDLIDKIDGRDGLRQRIRDLIDATPRVKVESQDEAARATHMLTQMKACLTIVEGFRKEIKEPYLSAGRAVDEQAAATVSDLKACSDKVRDLTEGFLREEEKKRRAAEAAAIAKAREEEAARQAELAAAEEEGRMPAAEALAPVKVDAVPDRVQVRSELGGLASTRTVKKGIVLDYRKAFKAVETVPAVREAIDKAIAALVRAGQTKINGVSVVDDIVMQVR